MCFYTHIAHHLTWPALLADFLAVPHLHPWSLAVPLYNSTLPDNLASPAPCFPINFKEGVYFDEKSGLCKPCSEVDPQCTSCFDGATCSACNQGYYLDAEKKCIKCGDTIANCQTCQVGAGAAGCGCGLVRTMELRCVFTGCLLLVKLLAPCPTLAFPFLARTATPA